MTLADTGLTWNLVDDVHRLLEFHFMVNAFRAGTIVAVVAAVIGWFMVLRRQTFAGHTLSIVAFPGASAAILIGISAAWGYFGVLRRRRPRHRRRPRDPAHGLSEESAVIGTVQAFALACGFLFVTLYHGLLQGASALLFGTFLGITDGQVTTLLIIGAAVLLLIAVIGRPLLFASIDPDVATASGVPVRALSFVFLVVLGVAVAEASQITGALLVFALLVVPAATARTLTARVLPASSSASRSASSVTWLGLALAYFYDQPIGFYITTLAFGTYVAAQAGRWTIATARDPSGVRDDRCSATPPATASSTCSRTPFIRHALLAGTAIAAASGLVGYFVVLRSQVFSGDALSHVAFTGALAALAFGIDARLGLFVATITVGLAIGLLGEHGRADDVVIGVVFTWILGLGVLFLSIFTTTESTGNGAAGVNVLFGSIFGLSADQATVAAWIGRRRLRRPSSRSPGPCSSPASTKPSPPPAASPSESSASPSSDSSASAPPKPPRQSARCSSSGSSPHPPVPRNASPTGRTSRSGCPAPSRSSRSGSAITISYLVADVPPSFAIMAVATTIYLGAFVVSAIRRHDNTADLSV